MVSKNGPDSLKPLDVRGMTYKIDSHECDVSFKFKITQ